MVSKKKLFVENVGKEYLVDRIFERSNGIVKKDKIRLAITIALEMIAEDLISNLAVSVGAFGTFAQSVYIGHVARIEEVLFRQRDCNLLRFYPHASFLSLLEVVKEEFKMLPDTKKMTRKKKSKKST